MTPRRLRSTAGQALLAIFGTGLAFAFLETGAFRTLGSDTLARMVEPASLRAAGLGAGLTALLLLPVLIWDHRRRKQGSG